MRSPKRRPVGNLVVAISLGVTLGLTFGAGAGAEQGRLQLEVILNGRSTQIVVGFVRLGDNRLGTTYEELEGLGLNLAPGGAPQNIVPLDDIPTLKYQYDERSQRLLITVDDAGRKTQEFDLAGSSRRRLERSQTGWGAVLNYDWLGSTGGLQGFRSLSVAGSSLSLDARAFSPYGTLEQTAIVQSTPQQLHSVARLNSTYRYSDQDRMITYGAGDLINGGLTWSRPIRIGGLQAESNFALRPDLITVPLPTLGGSAAVPSTVDVYVNSIRTFSQEIGTGPFSITNVPLISGAGNAELVIRDSAGHETRSTLPFYASSSLLAPGLTSWSLEGGLPRLSYGSVADIYVESPVGSATLRRGIFDGLTVETHAEGGAGVANGGIGAVLKTGTIGVAAAAVSASMGSGTTGSQVYASWETRLFGVNISASSQHTFGAYGDLASATARLQTIAANQPQNISGLFAYVPITALPSSSSFAYATGIYTNARAPIALDRITFSTQLPFDEKANLSASYIHLLDASRNLSNIVTGSYSRSIPYNASVFATVFHDFGTNRNTGIFGGLSMPLGDSASISTGVSRGQGGTAATVEVVKSLGIEAGSYGWRVRDTEGASAYREASGAYRSSYGTIRAGVSQSGSSSIGSLELRGSITTMDGGVFLSNWIDDSFAVVATGAPGVKVLQENRLVGVTDASGKLLVPTLRSYQNNKITIDPADLPVDAEVRKTHDVVAPADRAGVLVKFDVHSEPLSALVTFVRPDGSVVPAGAIGRGAGEFVVGYGGQAFIKDLAAANQVEIEFLDGKCQASFSFTPRPGEQVRISPVECR